MRRRGQPCWPRAWSMAWKQATCGSRDGSRRRQRTLRREKRLGGKTQKKRTWPDSTRRTRRTLKNARGCGHPRSAVQLRFRSCGRVDGVANLREQDDDFYQRPFDGLGEDRLPAVGLHVGLFEFARLKVSEVVDSNRHWDASFRAHHCGRSGAKDKKGILRPGRDQSRLRRKRNLFGLGEEHDVRRIVAVGESQLF